MTGRDYMLNEQFTWLTPFSQIDQPGLAWRTEAAKARGKTGGRPKTDPAKLEQARILYENSDNSASKVCTTFGISRRTFFNHMAALREAKHCEGNNNQIHVDKK